MSTIVKRGTIPIEHMPVFRLLRAGSMVAVMAVSDNTVTVVGINVHGFPQASGCSIPAEYFEQLPSPGMMLKVEEDGSIVEFYPTGYRVVNHDTYLCYDRAGFYAAYHDWGGDQDHIDDPENYPTEVRFMVDAMRRIGYQAMSVMNLQTWFVHHI